MAIKQIQATINGVLTTLTLNGTTGKYEATLTAPSVTSWSETGNKYGITLRCEDDAGNVTSADRNTATHGSNLQIRVLERTKPTTNITAPSSGARVVTATPTISFQLRDEANGSGININTLVFKVDANTISVGDANLTKTQVTGGYDCTYRPSTPLADGSHTIQVTIGDNDGNTSNTSSSSFVIDTNPPALNVTSPNNGILINTADIVVNGTTNDVHSSPVTVEVKLNGTSQGNATITGADFTKSITLREGVNTIEVIARDSSGLTSTVTRTVTLDTKAPVIQSVVLSKASTDVGTTFTITVEVTD